MSKAIKDVLTERQRQIKEEGWTSEHDDQQSQGQLARAAACYAIEATGCYRWVVSTPPFWPWSDEWWKPKSPRRDLVRAAALIIAEIERLDRKEAMGL